jgi:thiamine biosynthesis lipoprotein
MNVLNDESVTVQRVTVALGTFVSIEARVRGTEAAGRDALDAATAVFELIDATLHPTRAGSDLATIARARAGESILVQAWTFQVLVLARQLWAASEGFFDPCLPELPGRFGDLDLLEPNVVKRTGASLAIDLGGIAKGFAIDRAVELLQAGGCLSGLVNAGGDARVFGDERRVLDLRAGGVVRGSMVLANEALAVSEPRSAASPSEHRGFYSPLTGETVSGRVVAVRAGSAAIADALTKCAILCPPVTLQRLLAQYDARLVDLDSLSTIAR